MGSREYETGKPGINWLQVAPEDRKRLEGLIEHYRGKPHPFAACVRDNTERFGRERAERVCAVLKDLIEGGTGWRKGAKSMSEEYPGLDPEIVLTAEEIRAVCDAAEEIAGRSYYDPDQPRAPKGTNIGGRWIALLGRANRQKNAPGTDTIQAPDDDVTRALIRTGDLKPIGRAAPGFGGGKKQSVEITPKGKKTLAKGRAAMDRGVKNPDLDRISGSK